MSVSNDAAEEDRQIEPLIYIILLKIKTSFFRGALDTDRIIERNSSFKAHYR